MNNKLLQAILSMDSYNRGYNAGINLNTYDSAGNLVKSSESLINNYLGNIKIYDQSTRAFSDGQAQQNGFYAIAYQYEDVGVTKTVISYRGTDQFLDTEDSNGNIIVGGDVFNAYSQGGGDAETNQSDMAIRFYQAVVDAVNGAQPGDFSHYYDVNDVVVTGHSMGGGLAGLVGGLYALNGTIYSNMAYQQALLNLARATNSTPDQQANYTDPYSNEFYRLINNTDGPAYNGEINPLWLNTYASNWSNLEAYTIAGEVLNLGGLIPGGNSSERYPTQTGTPPVAYEIGVPTGFFSEIDPFDTHNVATLVMRIYAEDMTGNGYWGHSAQYFWPVAYDNQFAINIGVGSTNAGRYIAEGGAHGYDKTMRTMIAYSALTAEGTLAEQAERLPFGDTAIRALYNDASNLGEFFATGHQLSMSVKYLLLSL